MYDCKVHRYRGHIRHGLKNRARSSSPSSYLYSETFTRSIMHSDGKVAAAARSRLLSLAREPLHAHIILALVRSFSPTPARFLICVKSSAYANAAVARMARARLELRACTSRSPGALSERKRALAFIRDPLSAVLLCDDPDDGTASFPFSSRALLSRVKRAIFHRTWLSFSFLSFDCVYLYGDRKIRATMMSFRQIRERAGWARARTVNHGAVIGLSIKDDVCRAVHMRWAFFQSRSRV